MHAIHACIPHVHGMCIARMHRCWANLREGTLGLYEEVVRGERRARVELPLGGCVCKAPPSSKKRSVSACLVT